MGFNLAVKGLKKQLCKRTKVAGKKVVPFSETKISRATIPVLTETSQNDTVVFVIFLKFT
jgi:hypothetical protein